ncbi:MAG: hypothetical protein ACRC2U_01300 [Aeromonas sp.]
MSDFYWTFRGQEILQLDVLGISYHGPQAVHDGITKMRDRGALGYFAHFPHRQRQITVTRKSFSLTPSNALWLAQFDNQSAEVDRLITQEREQNG